jgi:hypothetical protein
MPKKRTAVKTKVSAQAEITSTPAPVSLLAPAPLIRQHPFIVDVLFPRHELHIIGGPAHAGKTMLLFHIMENWSQSLNVFGYPSHPAKFCYVSCNHSLSACQEAAKCAGISTPVPMVSLVDLACKKNFDSVHDLAYTAVKDVEVIFLDGILYIAGNSGLDNAAVGEFLSGMIREMKQREITVVATGRCAKPKDNKSSVRSIDRFLGATAWTELSSTFIAIEPKTPNQPRNDRRVVTVMPKRAPTFTLAYRFSGEGKLSEVSDEAGADSPERLEEIATAIDARGPGQRIATAELLDIGKDYGVIARSSMMNYVSVLLRQGRLQDGGHGWYMTPSVQ